MSPQIINYLLSRGITKETIERFSLSEINGSIVIPIKDKDGKVIFNKYRRNPSLSTGMKYWYDRGGSVVLFNSAALSGRDDETIVITEGELDALILESNGIHAVTSTGGATSFQESWAIDFVNKNNVIVCFDNDEAGVKGMIRVQQFIPHAQMIFLPEEKDITDYIQKYSVEKFLALPRHTINIPNSDRAEDYRDACDQLVDIVRQKNARMEDTRHMEMILKWMTEKYHEHRQKKKRIEVSKEITDERLRAKSYPIDQLLKFNRQGYAPCLWHNEKTASLYHFKKDNHVYCFGCSKKGDAIDIVMVQKGLGFKEAIKYLNTL